MGRRFRNDPAMLGTTLWYAVCKCIIDWYGGRQFVNKLMEL